MEDRWKNIKIRASEDTRKKELKNITGRYFSKFFPPTSCLISRNVVVCSKLILSPEVIIENICFQSAERVNIVMYIWRQSWGVASREHSPLEQIFFWFWINSFSLFITAWSFIKRPMTGEIGRRKGAMRIFHNISFVSIWNFKSSRYPLSSLLVLTKKNFLKVIFLL